MGSRLRGNKAGGVRKPPLRVVILSIPGKHPHPNLPPSRGRGKRGLDSGFRRNDEVGLGEEVIG